jgi:uncharacterized protein YoaH (UPF0181 family)
MRTTVHKYIDEADAQVLEVVYQLLEVYRQSNSSQLTHEQHNEVLERSETYKAGKTKGYSSTEARRLVKQKLST